MLKSLIKIFLTFTSISNIYAQAKFEPGYIVQSSGDTIRGMIDYRNWSKNPRTIRFRDSQSETDKTLGLNDLSAFQVRGENYERAEVTRNNTPFTNNNLTEKSLPELVSDTVFLLRLVDGPKSLYYLRGEADKIQLYIGPDHQLLVYHKYQMTTDNVSQIVIIDRYRQQLKTYLDCEDVSKRVASLRYASKDVIKLFELYYSKCSTAKPKTITKREGLGFEAGALAGAAFSKLTFKGYHFEYLTQRKHAISARPTVGLSLNMVIPRTRRNVLIANELVYSSYKISDHFRTDVNAENYTDTDFTYALNHLRINNMVRYRISLGHAFFYANVGISNGFLISENNRYLAKTHFHTDVHVKEDKALESRKHNQGFNFGIGAGVAKLGFEARFENSNGNSNFFSLTSNVKQVLLLVHYRF